PWGRASAAEDLGVLLAGSRDHVDDGAAIEALDRALEGYQQIGALRDAARIRARLRRLGVRRRHWTQSERPLSGWSSLTETERNVAALAAQGLTNPQVATQMFVSPHTVKFHLRQVFRKLGIASRVELARLATEHASESPAEGLSQGPRP
ncbi:helix-turn-helix transcriptional regulator, partial [Actinoallomurus acaciae]